MPGLFLCCRGGKPSAAGLDSHSAFSAMAAVPKTPLCVTGLGVNSNGVSEPPDVQRTATPARVIEDQCRRIGVQAKLRPKVVRQCLLALGRSGSGTVSKSGLRALYRTLNLPESCSDVLFQKLDTTGAGAITFDSLRELLMPYIKTYASADDNGSKQVVPGMTLSKLTLQAELKDLCKLVETKAYQKPRFLCESFRGLDVNGSGAVTRSECVRLLESLSFPSSTANRVFDLVAEDLASTDAVSLTKFMDTLGPCIHQGYELAPKMNQNRKVIAPPAAEGKFRRKPLGRPSSAQAKRDAAAAAAAAAEDAPERPASVGPCYTPRVPVAPAACVAAGAQEVADMQLLALVRTKACQKPKSQCDSFRFIDRKQEGSVSKDECVQLVERLNLPTSTAIRVFHLLEDGSGTVDLVKFMDTLGPLIHEGYKTSPRMNRLQRPTSAKATFVNNGRGASLGVTECLGGPVITQDRADVSTKRSKFAGACQLVAGNGTEPADVRPQDAAVSRDGGDPPFQKLPLPTPPFAAPFHALGQAPQADSPTVLPKAQPLPVSPASLSQAPFSSTLGRRSPRMLRVPRVPLYSEYTPEKGKVRPPHEHVSIGRRHNNVDNLRSRFAAARSQATTPQSA